MQRSSKIDTELNLYYPQREYTPSMQMAHPWKSLLLSRVVVRTLENSEILLQTSAGGSSNEKMQACILLDMSAYSSHEADSPFHAIT